MSSSSSTPMRPLFACGDCVRTTMPSATCVAQAIWSFGAFYVHEAHAAHAGHRQSRVVAVVRHEHPRLLGGLDHERPLGNAHGHAVDREVDELVGHQATMTGFRRPAI